MSKDYEDDSYNSPMSNLSHGRPLNEPSGDIPENFINDETDDDIDDEDSLFGDDDTVQDEESGVKSENELLHDADDMHTDVIGHAVRLESEDDLEPESMGKPKFTTAPPDYLIDSVEDGENIIDDFDVDNDQDDYSLGEDDFDVDENFFAQASEVPDVGEGEHLWSDDKGEDITAMSGGEEDHNLNSSLTDVIYPQHTSFSEMQEALDEDDESFESVIKFDPESDPVEGVYEEKTDHGDIHYNDEYKGKPPVKSMSIKEFNDQEKEQKNSLWFGYSPIRKPSFPYVSPGVRTHEMKNMIDDNYFARKRESMLKNRWIISAISIFLFSILLACGLISLIHGDSGKNIPVRYEIESSSMVVTSVKMTGNNGVIEQEASHGSSLSTPSSTETTLSKHDKPSVTVQSRDVGESPPTLTCRIFVKDQLVMSNTGIGQVTCEK